jgi:hypothetical protein
VVHLRIVVPSHQPEQALELLDNTSSVADLIHLEGADRSPQGDVMFIQRRLYVRRRRERLYGDARERAGLPIGQSRRGRQTAGVPAKPASK